MPFVSNMPDDEEQKGPQNASQAPVSPTGGGGSVHLAPSAAVPSGGSGGASTGSSSPAAGGQFASLNKYIDANQGQAAPLAGKITSGINKQYNDLDTANNAAISDVTNQVKNAPGYTASNPDTLAQEVANPVSFASDPNNVKQFQSLLQNTYSGPASAEGTTNFSSQQNAINDAIAKGTAATTTEAGRTGLLQQNEAAPTTGVTALNSAILSQDPNALSSIESSYKPFGNLLANLNTGAGTINKTIGQETADAAASNKAANDAISKQVNDLNSSVTNTTAADEKARQDYNSALAAYQAQYNPISSSINSLNELFKNAPVKTGYGGAFGQLGNPYATGLAKSVDNTVPTAETVATPEQYQQAQAFQNLLAGLNLGVAAPILNQSTANQAGTYKAPDQNLGPTNDRATLQKINTDFNNAVSTGYTPGATSYGNEGTAAFYNQYAPTYNALFDQLKQANPDFDPWTWLGD